MRPCRAIGSGRRRATVPVPLLAPGPPVALDLQTAVDAGFALVGYERLIDYTVAPPLLEMSPDDRVWVDARLREARLRPA